jgi:hypothetical protein
MNPSASRPHWNSHASLPPPAPIERLALLEYQLEEMAERLDEMQTWRESLTSRLWLLDIMSEISSHVRAKIFAALGRSIEIAAYLIAAYLLSHIPAISAILSSAGQ